MANRRESRENRRTSRTHPSIDYIFYSYYVSPSLDALMPTRTRRRINPGRAPSLARIVFVVFVAWLNVSLKQLFSARIPYLISIKVYLMEIKNLHIEGSKVTCTRNFLVRTSVPTECPNAPIVWVNSIDQLIRADTS